MRGKYLNQPIIEAVQIEKVLYQLQQDGITIPRPSEVRDYLISYPDMTDLLLSACDLARQQFDSQVQLSLEVYHDPEIEDEYLTLYIRQQNYDEDILDTIEDICALYEGKLAGKSGWFLVTTDFRSP